MKEQKEINKTKSEKNQTLKLPLLLIVGVAVVLLFVTSMKKSDVISDGNLNHATEQGKESLDDVTNGELGNVNDDVKDSLGDDSANEYSEKSPGIGTIQKVDASYERWLAAAMVTAISLQYTEFEINGIYFETETDLTKPLESSGVYVTFAGDGEMITIHSEALTEERTEAGTMDLYTMDLGFATFDTVDVESVNISNMQSVQVEDLSELISQSMLVSLYER